MEVDRDRVATIRASDIEHQLSSMWLAAVRVTPALLPRYFRLLAYENITEAGGDVGGGGGSGLGAGTGAGAGEGSGAAAKTAQYCDVRHAAFYATDEDIMLLARHFLSVHGAGAVPITPKHMLQQQQGGNTGELLSLAELRQEMQNFDADIRSKMGKLVLCSEGGSKSLMDNNTPNKLPREIWIYFQIFCQVY
jgi:hypothetical protein